MPRFLIDVNLPYRFSVWFGSLRTESRPSNDEMP